MKSIVPHKNEVVFVVATIFFAVGAGITLLSFVRWSASNFNVTTGVVLALAAVGYLAGILWGFHEDGKRRD
jgi:small neutral amino acid transporter SnatA (MarC family)